jgi:predicted adenylyl cyclase CyaB
VPSNLELKASIPSIKKAVASARGLGASERGVLHQTDTYYRVPRGRLKLRIINGSSAELIAYQRPDQDGGRYSSYVVLPVTDPAETMRILQRMFGVWKVVKKKRTLYIYKNARIHLDVVSGLGTFLEFEVVVKGSRKQARAVFEELVTAFDVRPERTFSGSYSDMVPEK